MFERELATVEAADLAVFLVGAEGRIHPAEPLEQFLEHRVRVGVAVAEIDDDRHAHDVLDPAQAGQLGEHQAFFALRIADWSDCRNASLV